MNWQSSGTTRPVEGIAFLPVRVCLSEQCHCRSRKPSSPSPQPSPSPLGRGGHIHRPAKKGEPQFQTAPPALFPSPQGRGIKGEGEQGLQVRLGAGYFQDTQHRLAQNPLGLGQPARANENSPPFQRWVSNDEGALSPAGTKEFLGGAISMSLGEFRYASFAPNGASRFTGMLVPTINRRAMNFRPSSLALIAFYELRTTT